MVERTVRGMTSADVMGCIMCLACLSACMSYWAPGLRSTQCRKTELSGNVQLSQNGQCASLIFVQKGLRSRFGLGLLSFR